MSSQIDPSLPIYGSPTTQSVRDNFEHARDEIVALQDETVKQSPTGNVEVIGVLTAHGLDLHNVQVHSSNAAAHAAGLPVGRIYRDLLGELRIVY